MIATTKYWFDWNWETSAFWLTLGPSTPGASFATKNQHRCYGMDMSFHPCKKVGCHYSSMLKLQWSSRAQSVCQWTFSLLAIWCLKPCVRILHSAEEDNLFSFDSNIACLCQNIEINNSKHVYRQSQVRKPTGSGVEWAESSLIIGMGSWVHVLA